MGLLQSMTAFSRWRWGENSLPKDMLVIRPVDPSPFVIVYDERTDEHDGLDHQRQRTVTQRTTI